MGLQFRHHCLKCGTTWFSGERVPAGCVVDRCHAGATSIRTVVHCPEEAA